MHLLHFTGCVLDDKQSDQTLGHVRRAVSNSCIDLMSGHHKPGGETPGATALVCLPFGYKKTPLPDFTPSQPAPISYSWVHGCMKLIRRDLVAAWGQRCRLTVDGQPFYPAMETGIVDQQSGREARKHGRNAPASTSCTSIGHGRYLSSPIPLCRTRMMFKHVSRPM